MSRNILINSQLKRILLLAAASKSETKLRKTEKNTEKENTTDESDFSENEIPDSNSLKPFQFEANTNTIDINSSSSHNDEKDIEYKVKGIGHIEWCECSKQCKPMETYTESLFCQEKNDIPEWCS